MPCKIRPAAVLLFVGAIAGPALANPTSFTRLGFLPGALYSDAFAVSASGAVVAGVGQINGHDRAFRWTSSGGMIDLGVLPRPGYDISGAFGITPDGVTIVGGSQNSMSPDPSGHSFRWTAATGLVDLGD